MSIKVALAEAIREQLDSQGLTVRQLAEQIGYPDATVRTWLHRNIYPRNGAALIGGALGLGSDPDKLGKKYTIDGWATPKKSRDQLTESSLRSVFQYLDRRRDRLGHSLNNMSRDVAKLMGAMRQGDLFVFLSATVTPLEFEKHLGQQLVESIADGVIRGGTYVYLRPDDAVIQQFYRHDGLWRLRRILMHDDFETEFADFRHNLLAQVQIKGKLSENAAREEIMRHTAQFHVHESLFWSPGFTIGMFQTQNNLGVLDRRMTLRLPTDYGGIIYLPPDQLFTWRFVRCVHQALDEEEAKLNRALKEIKKTKGPQRRMLEEELKTFTTIKQMIASRFTPE